MNLDKYILKGYRILPQSSMTIAGSIIPCLKNLTGYADVKDFGGFVQEGGTVVFVESSHLPVNVNIRGVTVYYEGANWRIIMVQKGDAITALTLESTKNLK